MLPPCRVAEEVRIELLDPGDSAQAVMAARSLAARVGFDESAQFLIATAVSELATNIIRYAGSGEVTLRHIHLEGREGFEVSALDAGPGIGDLERAMCDHYSTGASLGLGLPSVKRIMNDFHIESKPRQGTLCVARKWR